MTEGTEANVVDLDSLDRAGLIAFLLDKGNEARIEVWNAWRRKHGAKTINLVGANLVGANLYGANLDGANLVGANLVGASLYRANLDGANLDGANLVGASLDGASLYGASLDGASLYGANLDGASLDGATLNWNDHQLLSEILLRAAGEDVEKRMIAGLIRVSRDWCWDQWLRLEHPKRDWAIVELGKWLQPDDNAPPAFRRIVERINQKTSDDKSEGGNDND